MRLGLGLSLLAHAGLIALALISMLATPALTPPEPEPIAIALITPSDVLRLKQGDVDSKELEAKAKENEPKPQVSRQEAEKPNPVTAPEPPAAAPPPEAKEEPKEEPKPADPIADKIAALPPPGPTPEELKRIEDQKKAEEEKKRAEEEKKKAEDKRKAEEKKKAEEARKKKLAEDKRKAEEAKKKAQADRMAALLNKDPTKQGAPQSATPPSKPTDYTGPTAGAEKGNDTVLSAREQDLLKGMLKSQIAPCWRLPGGGGGTETPIVTLRFKLRPDGALDGEPKVENPGTGAFSGLAVEAALRAVKSCQPFRLPPDSYQGWKEVIWEFDPSQML